MRFVYVQGYFFLFAYGICFQLVPTEGWENTYIKPNPPNEPCIKSIERIQTTMKETISSEGEDPPFCLGCSDMTQGTCPTKIKCQQLIDDLYSSCDGVTLPPRYFYDPPVSFDYSYI